MHHRKKVHDFVKFYILVMLNNSKNIPNFLGSMAEFAARHARTQTVVTDTDGLVLEGISKVVMAFRHRSNEDADALLGG